MGGFCSGGRRNGVRTCCDRHIMVYCTRCLGILFPGFSEDVSDVAVVEGKLPPIRSHRQEQVSRVDQQDRVEHERVEVRARSVSRLR